MREYELREKLAERLGEESARLAVEVIISEWGGCRLDIPKGRESQRRRRDNEIRRLASLGVSHADLERRYGLSGRHLRRIIGQTCLTN